MPERIRKDYESLTLLQKEYIKGDIYSFVKNNLNVYRVAIFPDDLIYKKHTIIQRKNSKKRSLQSFISLIMLSIVFVLI